MNSLNYVFILAIALGLVTPSKLNAMSLEEFGVVFTVVTFIYSTNKIAESEYKKSYDNMVRVEALEAKQGSIKLKERIEDELNDDEPKEIDEWVVLTRKLESSKRDIDYYERMIEAHR